MRGARDRAGVSRPGRRGYARRGGAYDVHPPARPRAGRRRRRSGRCSRRCAALPALAAARRAAPARLRPDGHAGRLRRRAHQPRAAARGASTCSACAGRAGARCACAPRGGAWSPWIPLAAHGDHAPDTGTRRARLRPGLDRRLATSSSCGWRARRAASLRVHFVAVPAAAAPARAAACALGAGAPRAPPRRAASQPGSPPPIVPARRLGRRRGAAALGARATASVQAAFVHHTVTANEYAPQDSPAIVLGIAKYHRDTNGWNDIGYNFLVDRYGQVFEGRAGGIDQAVVGAHAQGYNAAVDERRAARDVHARAASRRRRSSATAQLLGWKLSLHGVPVRGHRRAALRRREPQPLSRPGRR